MVFSPRSNEFVLKAWDNTEHTTTGIKICNYNIDQFMKSLRNLDHQTLNQEEEKSYPTPCCGGDTAWFKFVRTYSVGESFRQIFFKKGKFFVRFLDLFFFPLNLAIESCTDQKSLLPTVTFMRSQGRHVAAISRNSAHIKTNRTAAVRDRSDLWRIGSA